MLKDRNYSGLLFLVPVGAQALITLISIPIIISSAGNQGWASIATGQAVGGFLGVVCGLGWNVTGPSIAAVADVILSRRTLKLALFTRLMVSIPLFLIGIEVVYLLHLARLDLAVLGLASTLVISFNMQWFFVGQNKPVLLVLYDSIPRLLTLLAGWMIVLLGANVSVGLAGQILSSLVAAAIVCVKLRVFHDGSRLGFPTVWREIFKQGHGLSTEVLPAFLSYCPMIAISALAPSIAPLYALIDKVHKQLVTGLVPMGNFIVAKLLYRLNGSDHPFEQTVRGGMNKIILLGTASCLGTLTFGEPLIWFLSHKTMSLHIYLLVLLSVLVGLTVVVAILPYGLMAPMNCLRQASISLLLGTVIGISALVTLTVFLGAVGTLLGQVIGYATAILFQWLTIRRILSSKIVLLNKIKI
ncbi:hypothetical protein AAGW05_18385 [Arthrobacter sp. LAPM80]|uniref:hypothetical protein n=1 Tax=Arthrobacter sp. LAPM80 TaxID=3141788 RepID=UPI00398B6231